MSIVKSNTKRTVVPRRRSRSISKKSKTSLQKAKSSKHSHKSETELISEPIQVDSTPIEFTELGLDSALMLGVNDRGYVRTTPIQNAVFSIVQSGHDLIASAETGSGKTAAFLLPLMQQLIEREVLLESSEQASIKSNEQVAGYTKILILVPTRELAVQIEDDFQGFAYHAALSGVAVYGGVAMEPQERALRAGVDFVVATPGRLLDHMRGDVPNFERLGALVLDEADRMLDMGFWPDVRKIVSALPSRGTSLGRLRQTLLFSATMPEDVIRLASELLYEPKYVQLGPRGEPARTIKHSVYKVITSQKTEWLARFLKKARGSALVFVQTKRGTDIVVRRLVSRGIRAVAFHADRTQSHRTEAIEGFRSGKYKVLVATDIAARGLDIEGIEHVVNFEVPTSKDAYVHRVGRTGRADSSGHAVTLVAPEEHRAIRALEETFDLQLG